LQEVPRTPDFVAGHSLGEYNALLAAGAFDFETGLKLVQKRGDLMSTSGGGGMAAIIGLREEEILSVLHHYRLDTLSIANYNSYTQLVISGPLVDIKAARTYFKSAGARAYIPLKVSGAFHSHYMEHAQQEFSKYIRQFTFSTPRIQVISNIKAKPTLRNEITESLTKQITHPVHWTQSIRYLLDRNETVFEEIGPNKVLTHLIKDIRNDL
jgi:malonyl CoA-acyl carrier protein transacylase